MPIILRHAIHYAHYGILQGATENQAATILQHVPYGTRALALLGNKLVLLRNGKIEYQDGPHVVMICDVIALERHLESESREDFIHLTMSKDYSYYQFFFDERDEDNLLIPTTSITPSPTQSMIQPIHFLDEWTWNIVLAFWGARPAKYYRLTICNTIRPLCKEVHRIIDNMGRIMAQCWKAQREAKSYHQGKMPHLVFRPTVAPHVQDIRELVYAWEDQRW